MCNNLLLSLPWKVLKEIDNLNLHKQCQIGVLPLGTGNDLARVLGWGAALDDDNQLAKLLESFERATTKMLDRWSMMTYEVPLYANSATSATSATMASKSALNSPHTFPRIFDFNQSQVFEQLFTYLVNCIFQNSVKRTVKSR